MSNLMYSSKDVLMTRKQIGQLATPVPLGNRHNPVPFADFIDMVDNSLDNQGMEILTEEFAIGNDHNRFFGMMEIGLKSGDLIRDDDWSIFLGLRGAHDYSVPRALAIGSRVMCCSNLCFHGNIGTFSTKQTTNILTRLPTIIESAVSLIPEVSEKQQLAFDGLRGHQLTQKGGDAALVEILRRGGIAGSQLSRAVQEWDRPSHDEHAEGGFTAWRLMNACTEAVKPQSATGVSVETLSQKTNIISSFCNELVAA